MNEGYSNPVQLNGAVCFLVINEIEELPREAISSALRNTNLPILVGYISDTDVNSLRDLPVQFVRILEVEALAKSGGYSAFDEDDFYRIVMNKWELLLQNLPQYDYLIYSDIDVIWLKDAAAEVENIFRYDSEKDLIIQSFGQNEVSPSVCMGFVGLRNSPQAINFLQVCRSRHRQMILKNPRIGDDDIATLILAELKYPKWLHRLSPIYFPVGNVLNLFTTKPKFPGLSAPRPFIFHLNYVVGLDNKRLMLRILSSQNLLWGIESSMSIQWWLRLHLKKLKFFLGNIRRKFE